MNLENVENKLLSPKNTDLTESARKRMRLNNTPSKSWSLIDNSTDQETLEEMGVSLLEPDDDGGHVLESGSLLKSGSKRKYNLENVNPNVNSAPSSEQKKSPKRSPKSIPSSPIAGSSGLCDSASKTALSEVCIQDTYQTTWAEEETPNQTCGPLRLGGSPRGGRSNHVTPRTGGVESRCGKAPSTASTPPPLGRSPPPPGGVDSFSTLSDEVLLGIFVWLPKRTLMHAMRVCKRWQRIASDETFWQRLELGNKTINKGALGRILARKPIIVRLAASEIGEWHPKDPIIEQSRIQYLDLSMCTIDTETLASLLSRCRHLRKLSVESVALDDGTCTAIGKCSKLETLNMAMATGVTAEGLDAILEGCTSLQSLNTSWCGLCAKALTLLASKAPSTLLRLNVAGARIMTDDMVAGVVARCPLLLELDVSDCPRLSAAALQHAGRLARLEHVALSRCYLLPPHALAKLNSMPSLQYVEVWGMLPDASLAALKAALPRVQINQFMHSAIARPTVGTRRTSIWGLRTRD